MKNSAARRVPGLSIPLTSSSRAGLPQRWGQLSGFALLCLFGVAGSGCNEEARGAEAKPEQAAPKLTGTRVEVAEVRPSVSGLRVKLPGEVEAKRDAQLSAPLGGYIESVSVEEGAHVNKGAVLARVDSSTHSTRLIRSRVERDSAARELERAKSLRGTIPDAEIDAAEDRLATAEAALRELQVNAQRSVITAPFAGVVTTVEAEVGEVAQPGMPLFRLVQLQPVRVSVALSDRDRALAQEGMGAQVSLNARGGLYPGKVVQLSRVADLKTRSFEALVELPNEKEELLPGMIAQVYLSTAGIATEKNLAEERLLISQDWVVTKPSELGVFVEENGVARWRPVQLGQVLRDQVEVTSGLSSGDAVVIVGHRSLADGDPVMVQRRGRCCENGRAIFGDGPSTPGAPPGSIEGVVVDEATQSTEAPSTKAPSTKAAAEAAKPGDGKTP